VINRDTDELIREIPAEKVLDMAAKLDEMIGILFDAKV
jgi:flagellar protein FlaG